VLRHLLEHLTLDDPTDGESDEHVRALQGLGDRASLRLGGEPALVLVEVLAAAVNHTLLITHHDVLALHAELHVVLGGSDRGGPRP